MTKGFHFSELPTEIRLQIYRLSLPHSTYKSDGEEEDCPVEWMPGCCPSILFTNHQIHHEAADVLYHENVFSMYIRHPRKPRLPMNESRADTDSFFLISWKGRSWSNPRNPRLPSSVLKNGLVRRLHISLPPFDDLLGM